MRAIVRVAIIGVLCFMVSPTDASVISSTRITSVLVGEVYGNVAMIGISVKPTQGVPACQQNADMNYAFDISTSLGKATLELVLAAYLAQRDVYLNGWSRCDLFSNVETLRQIWTK